MSKLRQKQPIYGYSQEHQNNREPPVSDSLLIICWLSLHLSDPRSLADAELPKNIPEDFVGGYLAGDAAEIVESLTEILGYEVAWGM